MILEFYYDNAYQIWRYTPFMALYFFYGDRLRYYLSGKRFYHRSRNYSPFKLRLKSYLNHTFIGKVNLYTHIIYERLREKYFSNLLYNNMSKPNSFAKSSLFLGIAWGAIYACAITEVSSKKDIPLVLKTQVNFMNFRTADKSSSYVFHAKNPELANVIIHNEVEKKLSLLNSAKSYSHVQDTNEINNNVIDNKILSTNRSLLVSDSDFMQYGKLLSSVFQEEIAFQCYYIAYLKNRKIGTNSQLKFQTKI